MPIVPYNGGSLSQSYNDGFDYGDTYNFWQDFQERRRQKVRTKQLDERLAQEEASKRKKVAPKKSMGGPISVAENKLVGRSSMVVRGKTKLKHEKKVKISRQFYEKVEKVMESRSGNGHYKQIYGGYICSAILNSGTDRATIISGTNGGNILGATGQIAVVGGTVNLPPVRTMFNQLVEYVSGNVTGGQMDARPLPGTEMNFFTIGKILDAASVLFNKKPASVNPAGFITLGPYLTTGNLSEQTTNATGAVFNNNGPGNLKIEVKSSHVSFKMKNLSDRILTIEIWELVPTLKFQDTSPLTSLEAADAQFQASTVDTELVYGQGTLNFVQEPSAYMDPNFEFMTFYNEYGFKYKGKKRTMILHPQETCNHSIMGPSGTLDFSKLLSDQISKTRMLKDWSVGCIFAVTADQVYRNVGNPGGKYVNAGSVADQWTLSNPVAIEVTEVYNIQVPEIAGMITNNGAAGTTQLLNLNKDKKVIWNRCGQNNSTSGQITVIQETTVTPGSATR